MAGYTGIVHAGLAAANVSIRPPQPGEPPVQHLEVGMTTNDLKRAQGGLPPDSLEKPFVLLPPEVTGASNWVRMELTYRGAFPGGYDAYGTAVPLLNQGAAEAALKTGVAFGLELFGKAYYLQSPKTNLTPGPSNVRGLAGVTGAQTPSDGNVAMRQDTQDPAKSTLNFEYVDNKGIFGDAPAIQLKVAISSAKRFQDGKVTGTRTDRKKIDLQRVGPNRYAGGVEFLHGGQQTANPATSFSREIDAVRAVPVGAGGVSDGKGDGVRVR